MIILAFDLGIKNLAFCLLKQKDESSDKHTIIDWNNIDLLAGGVSTQSANRCKGCNGPGHYIQKTEIFSVWCKGCATGIRRPKKSTCKPSLPVLVGCVNKKLPKLTELRKLAGPDFKKSIKEEIMKHLETLYLVPFEPPKAKAPPMYEIFKNMSAWIDSNLENFKQADIIRIENQPVHMAPVIKSVQMILFTLLWEKLTKTYDWKGIIQFVHAKKKTEKLVEESTDSKQNNVISHVKPEVISDEEELLLLETKDEIKENVKDEKKEHNHYEKKLKSLAQMYAERKKAAEDETDKILKNVNESEKWIEFFKTQTKKSDLADCLLMSVAPVMRLTNS